MPVYILIVSRNIVVLIFAFLLGNNTIASDIEKLENTYAVESPNGNLTLNLMVVQNALQMEVRLGETMVLKPSPLIMKIDGSVITDDVSFAEIKHYSLNENFISRGIQSTGTNHYNGASIEIKSINKSYSYTLEARVFDDGIAFRFIIPGEGERIPEESTTFQFPTGSKVWYHDLYWHYEGLYEEKLIQDIEKGEWAAPPLTLQLPDDTGFISLSESGLRNYAGLTFQADGNGGLISRLGHEAPLGYPFAHDYTIEDANRLTIPAKLEGQITTPWRTLVVGRDLNSLVKSDLVYRLVPPPDEALFDSEETWVKPGRSVWTWLDGGERTLEGMKNFSKLAGELGFEYNTVDAFWYRWTDEDISELVNYSAEHGVKIWLWRHGRDIKDPQKRREFFQRCKNLGVVGVKLDAFSHESKEFIDLYQDCLRDAAEFQLMINFHGNNKPTGESRTWPNEMTREGIRGLEYGNNQISWAYHNTVLPFTRFVAGHGDYTPVVFGNRRLDTSWAHQIATAIVFTSPLLVYGAHPQSMLDNPGVEILKNIPSVWDETIVLSKSEIGKIAAFARRKGDVWFLAVLNGPEKSSFQISLDFLGDGIYQAKVAKDSKTPDSIRIENALARSGDTFPVHVLPGGGYVVQFTKK